MAQDVGYKENIIVQIPQNQTNYVCIFLSDQVCVCYVPFFGRGKCFTPRFHEIKSVSFRHLGN